MTKMMKLEEIISQNKKDYHDNYRKRNKKKFAKYQKRYYRTNRERILEEKCTIKSKDRFCLWCGKNIGHVRPRSLKFCNEHCRKAHMRKKKKELNKGYWIRKKLRLQKLQ